MKRVSKFLLFIIILSYITPLALCQKRDAQISAEWPYQESSQLVTGENYQLIVTLVDADRYTMPGETVYVKHKHEGSNAETITLEGVTDEDGQAVFIISFENTGWTHFNVSWAGNDDLLGAWDEFSIVTDDRASRPGSSEEELLWVVREYIPGFPVGSVIIGMITFLFLFAQSRNVGKILSIYNR